MPFCIRARNFAPISIDKCRLVVTSLVVFWWYGALVIASSLVLAGRAQASSWRIAWWPSPRGARRGRRGATRHAVSASRDIGQPVAESNLEWLSRDCVGDPPRTRDLELAAVILPDGVSSASTLRVKVGLFSRTESEASRKPVSSGLSNPSGSAIMPAWRAKSVSAPSKKRGRPGGGRRHPGGRSRRFPSPGQVRQRDRALRSRTPTSRCRSATAGRRVRARESPP